MFWQKNFFFVEKFYDIKKTRQIRRNKKKKIKN